MEFPSPDSTIQPPQPGDGEAPRKGNRATTVPPYWRHQRAESYASLEIVKPPPIRLEDHTEEPSEQSGAVWAKRVTILDHVIVTGNESGIGAYVVWNIKVETLDVRSSLLCSWLLYWKFVYSLPIEQELIGLE